jgi:hypothetical protein
MLIFDGQLIQEVSFSATEVNRGSLTSKERCQRLSCGLSAQILQRREIL